MAQNWDALRDRYAKILSLGFFHGETAYDKALAELADEIGTEALAELIRDCEDRAVAHFEERLGA